MATFRDPRPLDPIAYHDYLTDQAVAKKQAEGIKMLRQATAYASTIRELEDRVEYLVAGRHDYPIWPLNGVPEDAYERAQYEPIRYNYYRETIFLIRILRLLREAN